MRLPTDKPPAFTTSAAAGQPEELDEANINIELELAQGRSAESGKLQYALLKQSVPLVHCQYIG